MGNDNSKTYDVAIVGAGPAGSSAAIRLSAAGLKVLLIDKKAFPREKLCGAFISPECLEHFRELGVLDDIYSAGGSWMRETVFYSRKGGGVAVPAEWFGSTSSSALSLSRSEMDQRLLEKARQSGTEILLETKVLEVKRDHGSVSGLRLRDSNNHEVEIRTALVLDATGRARTIGRLVEKALPFAKPDFVAFRADLKNVPIPSDVCEIYVYNGGYGGCSRIENGSYNVCFIASSALTKKEGHEPEKVFRRGLLENERAAAVLAGSEIVSKWTAVPIQGYGRYSLVPASGVIAIGDAAAFIDPFTGSGILLALESARLASRVILSGAEDKMDFELISQRYASEYRAVFDKRLRICSLLRNAAFHPFLADMTIKTVGLSTTLRKFLAQRTRSGSQLGRAAK